MLSMCDGVGQLHCEAVLVDHVEHVVVYDNAVRL